MLQHKHTSLALGVMSGCPGVTGACVAATCSWQLTRRHDIKVDTEKRTILVESNVPMDRLVEASLEHSLVPPVEMGFSGITAGGGYSGTSAESSSFKYGFFDRTICRTEMVLASDEIASCSETEDPDLTTLSENEVLIVQESYISIIHPYNTP
ncbi:hypothetical protein AC579_2614 [Pseudocercospora musae]|uniref:FAD linked oxidase N-terminal domain-containing protein n=1 Tax=Pseudocercospora musae TaxID=113226 RepID=A0A139HUV1_9PEZI|nr:hypothetical protein AC579_2614 [Pseudocercospora musae]